MSDLINVSGQIIKRQHLNKSALSSLFIHYSGYEQILYLDIDTLVLGSLSPMLEALQEVDIAGVRGGVLKYLKEGITHSAGDEVSPEVHEDLLKAIPEIDFKHLAINTGCLAIRASVLEKWQLYYASIFPFLRYFQYVDQSIINILISTGWFKLREMPPEYNFAGLQDALREDSSLNIRFVVEEGEPAIYYEERRLILLHFSGRNKPWNINNKSPGSLAWQYFSHLP